jgi:hypothetical protein
VGRVEAMGTSRAEWPEPWQLMIKSISATNAWDSRAAMGPWKARPKHCLAKVTIMTAPARQP